MRDRQTHRMKNGELKRHHKHIDINRQTDKVIDRQTDKVTDKQTGRLTDRQTHLDRYLVSKETLFLLNL